MTGKTGGPVHPNTEFTQNQSTGETTHYTNTTGITLLDHFAGLAMQGELSSQNKDFDYGEMEKDLNALAIRAYRIANAMLRVREKLE